MMEPKPSGLIDGAVAGCGVIELSDMSHNLWYCNRILSIIIYLYIATGFCQRTEPKGSAVVKSYINKFASIVVCMRLVNTCR